LGPLVASLLGARSTQTLDCSVEINAYVRIPENSLGRAAYQTNPATSGAIYLRDNLRKNGCNPDTICPEFYAELSEYADRFAKSMAQMSSREAPVTYFIEHMEYIQLLIEQALAGESVEAPEPLVAIFKRYGLPAHTS
jgi:hypothetical protein